MRRTLLALALLCGAVSLRAQQPETMRVNADRVNLRVAPSIDSAIARALAKGTIVTVLDRDNAWVKVQTANASGWVRGSLLTQLLPPVPDAAGVSAPLPTAASLPSTAAPTPLAAAVPPTSNASVDGPHRLHVQLELVGGFTSAKSTEALESISGWRGSLAPIIPLGQHLGFMPEVSYVRYSSTSTEADSGSDEEFSVTIKESLAELTLGFRPVFGAGKASIFVVFGPEVNYLLTCSDALATTFGGATSEPITFSCLSTSTGDRFDYGVALGVGASIGPLVVQARGDFGLRDFDPDSRASNRNRALSVSVGLVL